MSSLTEIGFLKEKEVEGQIMEFSVFFLNLNFKFNFFKFEIFFFLIFFFLI